MRHIAGRIGYEDYRCYGLHYNILFYTGINKIKVFNLQ
jgi:hypothetical protein